MRRVPVPVTFARGDIKVGLRSSTGANQWPSRNKSASVAHYLYPSSRAHECVLVSSTAGAIGTATRRLL